MKLRVILPLVALLLAVGGGVVFYQPAASPATPTRTVELIYTARLPALPADAKTVRLWLPLPQSDEHQTIDDLKIISPLPLSEHTDPEYGNKYLYLEADRADIREDFEIKVHFHVARREHRVALDRGNGPGTVAAAEKQPQLLARFLQPDRLVPIDGVVGALSQQQTRGKEEPLLKARAVYDYVISTMRYDKSGTGWGRGDALYACDAKRGNCTDFHALFIGMMRAAGVPARFEIGFPLPPDQTEGEIAGYHCWAQFYVEPYGWIPVDASEAWKHPEQRDYFFGAHDVHRVLFTLGRDIRLDPPQQSEPLNYFVYPHVELDGRKLDDVETVFTFRDLPANGGATRPSS